MAQLQPPSDSIKSTANSSENYLIPFMLVTSLFFLWGFAISMLDVLNKHFQEVLSLSPAASTLVQVSTFGAYFIMSLPAGYFMKKYGYKKGILAGLFLYAAGAFLVFPASQAQSWEFFLIALFILACGLAFLETAANPYASVLGKPETSEQRLNLAQSFNGLGVIIGPLVGARFVFSTQNQSIAEGFASVQMPYMIVGSVVSLVAIFFIFTPLPEVQENALVSGSLPQKKLINQKHFVLAVIAQFFNVGAQICVWSLFINYATESLAISNQSASYWLSVSMVIFMSGRFAGTFFMRFINANMLLGVYCLSIVGLLLIVSFNLFGAYSIYALVAFFFFQSITFPTIFALGIKDVGSSTKQASSYIIMAVAGGAVFPPIMGYLVTTLSTSLAFLLPTALFAFIGWYGFKGSQLRG
jgi:FHS family L-fucose permease-like MFS transporter